MKYEFYETKFNAGITLIPETLEEAAQLLRISKNEKAEKPTIYTSFSPGQEIRTEISINKVAEKNQSNSINPKDR